MVERAGRTTASSYRTGPRRLGLGSRRVVGGAFGFSVALHLLLVWLYSTWVPAAEIGGMPYAVPSTDGARPRGIEVIALAENEEEPPLPPDRPDEPVLPESASPSSPAVDLPVLAGEAPSVTLERPGVTAAERLRPRPSDVRLWAPVPSEVTELTLEQREELALAGRLAEWYDSVAAVAAAEAAWTDWTFADAAGNRWGVSEGKLHLGSLTIPLPFTFQPPPGQREYLQQFNEIARQGAQGQIRQSVRERMEAIRARRDAERARARTDSTQPSR